MEDLMKKFIALILAAVMLICVFAACTETGPGPGNETGNPSDDTGKKPVSDDEVITSVAKQDYKGTSFTFLTISNLDRFTDEIFVDPDDIPEGDVILTGVYRRNDYVSKYLNVKIEAFPSTDAYGEALTLINSGDTSIDVYNLYKHGCIQVLTAGFGRNWMDLSIDYNNPWWNKSAFDNLSIEGKLYLMSGSVLISEIDDTIAMVYNKSLYNDFSLNDNIYELVTNNSWTLDKFIEIVSKCSKDVDGDGKYEIGNDVLGYIADPNSMAMNWPFACGFVKSKITDGVYEAYVPTSKITTMLEKLEKLFDSNAASEEEELDPCLNYFRNDKAFVCAIVLRNLETFRNMDSDYGVLPYPKFDESQKKYITHVGGASPIMIIPMQNCNDDDRLSNILGALCEASYRITRPAYYENALKQKGTRDDESIEILDLILDTRTYDLAYLSAKGVAWTVGGLVAAKSSKFQRTWASKGARTINEIQEMIDNILENNM